jgi:hypothetical protein
VPSIPPKTPPAAPTSVQRGEWCLSKEALAASSSSGSVFPPVKTSVVLKLAKLPATR